MVKGFSDAGFKPQVQPLTHFYDDYGLEPVDGEDDAVDDDDEDDEDEEEDDESDFTGSEEEDETDA